MGDGRFWRLAWRVRGFLGVASMGTAGRGCPGFKRRLNAKKPAPLSGSGLGAGPGV
jgi:hypothetical protein